MGNKKYTIKEFFESDKKLAIHTPTQGDAIKLSIAFDKAGYTWNTNNSYRNCVYFNVYAENTAYCNDKQFGTVNFYKNKNYTILKINDIVEIDENPINYTIKIEVQWISDEKCYYVFVNDYKVGSYTEHKGIGGLGIVTRSWLNRIIGTSLEEEELQDYLIKNHLVNKSI